VEGIELIAARMKATVYSRSKLRDRENWELILATMASMPDSTARFWVQTVSGQYQTIAQLHKMFPQQFSLATFPHCEQGIPESLGHFLTICPRF
jgi:hypothetical protein